MRTKIYLLVSYCILVSFNTLVAQNPGGVSTNLTLWIKSNTGTSTTTDGTPVSSWTYANDGSKAFTQPTGGAQPFYSANVLNFQAGLTFTGSQFMDGPNGANAPIAAGDDDYSAFVVWRSTSVTNLQRVWSQRALSPSSFDGFSLSTGGTGFNPGNYGNQAEIAPYTHTIARAYSVNSWNITQLNLLDQATGDLEIVDDRNLSSGGLIISTDPGGVPNGAALRTLSDALNRLGARDNAGDEPFLGDIAEVIVFDRSISGAERSKIFSYLAMKYGVTIGTDVVNSAGTTVWDATANSVYNNAVFGIARDDNSGLTVAQSNSVVTGSGDGTGQSGAGNIVLSNPSSLDDNDYLLIGNDGGVLSETALDLPVAAAGSMRLAREWKVQHTGDVGDLTLSFDFSGISITGSLGVAADFRLMVDADGDGDFSTGTVRYYAPSGFNGQIAVFSNVVLNDNEVFTIISSTVPITLPVSWVSFTGKETQGGIQLVWKVENNQHGADYSVEYSKDGINFTSIATIVNDVNVKSYSYLDKTALNGTNYYRIRQTDLDGRYTISPIVKVSLKERDFIVNLLSNPVASAAAELIVTSSGSSKLKTEIWTLDGRRIVTQQQVIVPGTNRIQLPTQKIATGQYIIRVELNNKVQSLKLIKL